MSICCYNNCILLCIRGKHMKIKNILALSMSTAILFSGFPGIVYADDLQQDSFLSDDKNSISDNSDAEVFEQNAFVSENENEQVIDDNQTCAISSSFSDSDTTGPTVSNVTIAPTTVNMGDYVTVSARVSDISGVRQNVSVQLCASAGNVAGGLLELVSGDEYDGIYEGTFQIPTNYSAGTWNANIYSNDTYGNSGGGSTSFTVNGYVDTTGPSVSDLTVSPDPIDMGDYLTVSTRISDVSGVRQNVSVQLCASAGNVAGGLLELVSGDEYDGIYEGTFQIPTNYSAGTWNANIYSNDTYGNSGGGSTSFTVNNAIKVHVHTEVTDPAVSATCTMSGKTEGKHCSVCKKILVAQKVIPASHKFGTWKTISQATVFAPEKRVRTCSVCGKEEQKEIGKKLQKTMRISATSLPLKVKQKTTALKVTGLAEGDSIISWKSNNTKIATISGKPDGTCTIKAGKKTGKAKITITLKSGLQKTVTVSVQKGTVKTKKITGIAKSLKLKKKQKAVLHPVIAPFTSKEKITYKSSNSKIATVNSKGQITAKKKGTVTITVKSGSKNVKCKVTVK